VLVVRIAIVGARGIGNYGGFETVVSELAPRLKQFEYDVSCTHEISEGNKRLEEYKGVQIAYFPLRFPKNYAMRMVFEILYDWYFALRFSFGTRFDIIYFLGTGVGPCLFLMKFSGSKSIVNIDGVEYQRAKYNLVEKSLVRLLFAASYRWADWLIVDNTQLIQIIPEPYRSKTRFVANGVRFIEDVAWNDDSIRELLGENDCRLQPDQYWLVVARMEPENNVHTIIEGYAKSKGCLPLVIVGSPSSPKYRIFVKRICENLAPNKKVLFLGSVFNQSALEMLRRHCLAYVHGHSVGGTNPSLLEAMAVKNTVIAHDNDFNREVCAETAIYFKDAESLGKIFDQVETGSCNFQDLGNKAYDRVIKNYNWDQIAKEYRTFLGDLGLS
jgi:rhamnosyltransferase